jgi:hypothetical protein
MLKNMTANQRISLILRLATVATFVIGLATLFFPAELIRIFDGYDSSNFHFVRFIGTALIGFSVTNWLYSTFTTKEAVLPAIYGNLTSLALAIIVDAVGLIVGVLASAAWLILALHMIFATAFVYCVFLIQRMDS